MDRAWYLNPAWYALGVSLVSLLVAWLALRTSGRASRLQLQRALMDRRAAINEAFLKYDVPGPYAHHLGIPAERVKPFTGKAALLFHQVNLLHEAYANRDLLGDVNVSAYENWAAKILRPWIEKDDELRMTWRMIRDSKDMLGADFVAWLDQRLAIVDKPAQSSSKT